MYNGDPSFALEVQMTSTAFHSHPYGHETIGHREDIEDYTPEKLERFYRNYYRPDNAVMMVIGDVDLKTSLSEVKKAFGDIENPSAPIPRFSIREPKQEGIRRVTVERPSSTNILSIGFKQKPFPTKDWFIATIMLDVLASGPESILHRLLVDTAKASGVEAPSAPMSEVFLSTISINLAPKQSHTEIEHLVIEAMKALDKKAIDSLVKKAKAITLTGELFGRQSSMGIAAELTEYVSSGDWRVYADTPNILKSITTKEILECINDSFDPKNLTIGHFVGKE
jgi:zinc protease